METGWMKDNSVGLHNLEASEGFRSLNLTKSRKEGNY